MHLLGSRGAFGSAVDACAQVPAHPYRFASGGRLTVAEWDSRPVNAPGAPTISPALRPLAVATFQARRSRLSRVIVLSLLTQEVSYHEHELGGQYFDERDRQAVQRRLVRRLEALGHAVSLHPTSTPAACRVRPIFPPASTAHCRCARNTAMPRPIVTTTTRA